MNRTIMEELIQLYQKQTLDGNTDPLPEPIDPRTQRLGLGDETLIISYALADSLRESSMRLAPSVGEYDSKNVVSAEDDKFSHMKLEDVWEEPKINHLEKVLFLEQCIERKSIWRGQLLAIFKKDNTFTAEEKLRLFKKIEEVYETPI